MPVILLADSCPSTRETLGRALRANGLDTLCPRTPAEAILLASRHQPDLFIIGLDDTDFDGFSLFHALNLIPSALRVPKLAFTASESGELHSEVMAAGFHGIMVRPATALDVVRTAWATLGWMHIALGN